MTNDTLYTTISSPEKQIWEGKAVSISSVNSAGSFDILPFHANFITIIENQPITIETEIGKQEFKFTRAILHVSKNIVHIYTEF